MSICILERCEDIGIGPVFVQLTIPDTDNVSIKLYDQFTGYLMSTLTQGEALDQGTHTFTLDTSFLPEGVYFVQVQTTESLVNEQLYINRE